MAAAGAVIAAIAAVQAQRRLQEVAVARAWDVFADLARASGLAEPARSEPLPSTQGDLHNVAVRVAIELDAHGWAHTFVAAPALHTRGFEIGITPSPRGALSFVKRIFGERHVDVGDPTFDKAFIVHAKPVEVAAMLVTEPVREVLVALAGRGVVFQADAQGTFVQWNGAEHDPAVLAAALDLVVTAARWRDLGDASYR